MDGKKKSAAAATGSSIVDDLFGPKDGATASPSSAGYFSTVFPAPSAAMGKDASRRAHAGGGGGKSSSSSSAGAGAGGHQGKQEQSLYGGSPESPYFGSTSVHYGGRDFYAAESHRQYPAADHQTAQNKHKDGDKQDDTSAATRGDWWQGSLYY